MGADEIPPSPEAFSKALACHQPVSRRHAAILKSWRKHTSKDDLWRAVQSAAIKQEDRLPPEPADFIDVVLSCAMPARRLNDHSEYVLNRFEKLKLEICKVVKDAEHPLDLWRDMQHFEKRLWELNRSDYPTDLPAGGRKDQKASRDRKLFAQRMFRYLKGSCGEHLLTEVTMMLDIFFRRGSRDKPHDERLVREWLAEISPKQLV
jgi:hypothetical protein